MSVVLSSHLVADLERACDYLIVLAAGRVQAADDISRLLSAYRSSTGTQADLEDMVLAYMSRVTAPKDPNQQLEGSR